MPTLWKVLTRRKVLTPDTTQETPLARVLNTFDLTALGVGSTLGVGVYVLAGQVAKNIAGPAVIISFLIAAIASVFAGLCYAEFGARAPRAGSAYIYSYLCVGEFVAFVIGWNLILEYIIGSASVAKGMSSYIDNLWNGTLSRTFLEIAPINLPYLSSYFDFFAFVVPVLLSVALAFGMKESSLVNNIFTTLNICVVLFVVIAGSLNAHLSNWFIDPKDVKNVTNGTDIGSGGFFPFGVDGVIKGAATCFYGFVGFDCIATTGEEVKNPKKAIPIAIVLSLAIIFMAYFSTSTVVTLMVPYYEQDPTAPIPFAFQSIHWYIAALIVSIGAIFGLYASLFGAMFPLPRILYAMASDGLIFRCMGQVNDRFKTPIFGTLFAGLFTGLMAALFNLESLVNMMSIGTLLAYTIVAASVLLLRYSENEKNTYAPVLGSSDSEDIEGYSDTPTNIEPINDSDDTALTEDEVKLGLILTIFNYGKCKVPNKKTELIVSFDICIYCILCFLLGLCGLHLNQEIMNREILPITAVSVILLLMALTMLSILSQPLSNENLSFQVPWVPLIPALSILFNIYLMIMLDIATWIRFVVWMILGIIVFHFSGRNISKKLKTISTDLSQQDFKNQNFYEEGHIVEHENLNDSIFEPNSIDYPDKQISNHKSLPHNNDDSKVLTPSKVLESLDLVLDSFICDPVSPDVMSIENVNFVPNVALIEANHQKNYEYRHTQNMVLHAKLLKALNIEDQSLNLENTSVEPIKISDQIHLTRTSIDEDKYQVRLESHLPLQNTNNFSCDGSTNLKTSIIAMNENDTAHEKLHREEDRLTNVELSSTDKFYSKGVPLDDEKTHLETLSSTEPNKSKFENLTFNKENEVTHHLNTQTYDTVTYGNIEKPEDDSVNIESVSPDVINISEHFSDTIKDDVDVTTFTPPIPPPMTSYLKLERKRSSLERDIPVMSGQLKPKKENHMNLFDENSLKLVKLRHVTRPSLDERFINAEHTLEVSHSLPETPIVSRHNKITELSSAKNMSESEMSMNTQPRMEISKDAINSLKLRPLKVLPSSVRKKDQYQKPDSIQFGSPEYEQFRSELNEKLKNPVYISRVPSFLAPTSGYKKKHTAVKNDDVIEDNIDMEKAKGIIQREIESKLYILNNSREDVNPNLHVEMTEEFSGTLPNEPNVQIADISNNNEKSPLEMRD